MKEWKEEFESRFKRVLNVVVGCHSEIVANEAPPGLFDGYNCVVYGNKRSAEEKLIRNIEAFIVQELKGREERDFVLLWRVIPEISKSRESRTFGGYTGYARLSIIEDGVILSELLLPGLRSKVYPLVDKVLRDYLDDRGIRGKDECDLLSDAKLGIKLSRIKEFTERFGKYIKEFS